jgi:hypothetical protein
MKNREIFVRDPVVTKILNDGVAAVTEGMSTKEIETLRYELEHFVCEGQYRDGLIRIIEAYIKNVDHPVQQAGWVSGFYGSGKSHLLKMLRHLWVDTKFPDGATARGLANLPEDVKDMLAELSTLGKRCNGLFASSGTLPSGGGRSVRLTILGIVFHSKGLPESYPQAKFCLWLKKNGYFDAVRAEVEAAGRDFLGELHDLYASPLLAKALLKVDPAFAPEEKQARATLRAQFPVINDIPTSDFVTTLREVLSSSGQVPCTLIVLDEVQLFIGDSKERATEVMEAAEALCKQLDSRVLLIGAGQTALSGTVLLQRLSARFTIPVELSDADVETVTRRVVLAKKADKVKEVRDCLETNAGEIDRQLVGTAIAPRSEDRTVFIEDYPLLPVRRRFWEAVLRAVDAPGTTAQLRTQLRIVHDAARETAEQKLGGVVPADFIFEQLQPDLLRTGVLLREIDETIAILDDGTEQGRLSKRICTLVFLIRKLPRDPGVDIGVRATADMLSDLLVADLENDGARLRKDVPATLEKLVAEGILIKLDDGYSLQTRESSEWDREFRTRNTKVINDTSTITMKRSALIAEACGKEINGIKILQGKSKEPRKLKIHFGDQPPPKGGGEIPVWIRDGWDTSEKSVVDDARAAGTDSPIIFVYIPRANADDIKKAIADSEAARGTLEFKGVPTTPEGLEARSAMEHRKTIAEGSIKELIAGILDGSKVFQGGGNERLELRVADKVRFGAEASLDRLFPDFSDGDHDRWENVITQAKSGNEGALQIVGWNDKVEKHPVCAAVLSLVGAGKKGKEIRAHFEDSPYGWPRDAVDAALVILHLTGHVRAFHNGAQLGGKQLDQAKIPVTDFRVERITIDAPQKIKLRKLFQKAGITCSPGEESKVAWGFLDKLRDLATRSGGNPPMPQAPAVSHIDTLRTLTGNEQLAGILKEHDLLEQQLKNWMALADLAARRVPAWERLIELLGLASTLPEAQTFQAQADALSTDRRLLDSSDPLPDIEKGVTDLLRSAVNKAHGRLVSVYEREMAALTGSDNWQPLRPEDKAAILAAEGIDSTPVLSIGDTNALLNTLRQVSLAVWKTRIDALPQQFANAALAAARLLEPKVQKVQVTSGTLRSADEVRQWIGKTEQELLEKLSDGPIMISS